MFQFRRFPTYAYLIQRRLTEYCSAGFPHSEIPGSKLMCSSPRLIAACHVLHRLSMPRHSPCALYSLTYRSLRSGSLRIMQASDSVHCSLCYPFKKVPQLKLCYLSVACSQFLACFTVQFSRCSVSNLFQGQIEMLARLSKHFDPSSKRLKFSLLPFFFKRKEVVGPSGLEPPTSRLSVVRSSQLSYGPVVRFRPAACAL